LCFGNDEGHFRQERDSYGKSGDKETMTATETEEHLRTRLKEHGYDLIKISHFKNFDRITFGNKEIKMSINLRGKLSELAFETLVEACIGKETKP
jgi:hypothetical protein